MRLKVETSDGLLKLTNLDTSFVEEIDEEDEVLTPLEIVKQVCKVLGVTLEEETDSINETERKMIVDAIQTVVESIKLRTDKSDIDLFETRVWSIKDFIEAEFDLEAELGEAISQKSPSVDEESEPDEIQRLLGDMRRITKKKSTKKKKPKESLW